MPSKLEQLNKTLFWDVDFKKLDCKKNADFIIKRVLSFGDEKDYSLLQEIYDLGKLKKTAVKIGWADKKTINFWSLIFNIPLQSFICIKRLSTQRPGAFLKR